MTQLVAALVLIAIAGALLAGGIWFGMLLAPRLGRLADPDDEAPSDDD